MTLMATKFTPEAMLSAPRRSAAAPNCTGTLALFTVTTYSFESHSQSVAIKILDIKTGQSTIFSEDAKYSEPSWISETEFALVKSEGEGTSLVVADATKPGVEPRGIQSFRGTLSNLKTKKIGHDIVAVACSVPTTPQGDMYNPINEKKPLSSARTYNKLFVRHWDAYVTENKASIWFGALKKTPGSWQLQGPSLINALAGTNLGCPVPPFGGAGDFDIGQEGLAFVSNDPKVNSAIWTKTDVYYVPLKTFTEEKPPMPQIIKTGKLVGYSGSPVFSHDGKKLAFKRMRHQQYESDKWRLLLVPDLKDLSNVQEFYKTDDGEGGWDQRPENIIWSQDDSELFVTAEHHGKTLLYRLPSTPLEAKDKPQPITQHDSVADVFNLGDDSGKLFIKTTSLIDSSSFSIVDPNPGLVSVSLVSSVSKQGRSFGLSPSQVSDFWCQGAGDYEVHALVMTPPDFDRSKKYPLAMLIHGGPQGAWGESWSTRWNPAIYASAGFVVVMPNPTGSTGYGQALTDAIASNWGGRPYEDLEKCFDYVVSHMPYVDTDRSVALGASYGGYMINWIQGHPLGRRFKALVYHDGIFSTMNDWATEELFFVLHDMGGPLWERRDVYDKWDPSRFTQNWATPQLVIHSELDYRLPITEGLATFNVLQTRGIPSRLLMFPDENHWVLKPENSLVWHKEVLGWINHYTGLAVDPELVVDAERLKLE